MCGALCIHLQGRGASPVTWTCHHSTAAAQRRTQQIFQETADGKGGRSWERTLLHPGNPAMPLVGLTERNPIDSACFQREPTTGWDGDVSLADGGDAGGARAAFMVDTGACTTVQDDVCVTSTHYPLNYPNDDACQVRPPPDVPE